MFVQDVLVPVKLLVNGGSIRQVRRDRINYFHVELAQHDVLLAEGLPVESYLETGGRSAFENGGAVVQLYPDFAIRKREALGCAPLVVTGPALAAARRVVASAAA